MSKAQLQLDAAFSSFSRQASDPLSIASMTAVGLVGRVGQVGLLRLLGSRFIAHLGSVGAEAATMSLIQGGSFTSHFINFATFRLMGNAFQTHNALLQHLSQSFAMMAGHQAAAVLHLEARSDENFAQQFLNALLSTLQIGVGNFLAHQISGHRIQIFERNLARTSPHPSPYQGEGVRQRRTGEVFSMVRPAEPQIDVFQKATVSFETVLQDANDTPCSEAIRNPLIEAYQKASEAGVPHLHRISTCLRFLFRLNAAHTSGGSFKNALLQEVVERSTQIENAKERNEAFQNIFKAMEKGLPHATLYSLVNEYAPPAFRSSGTPRFSPEFSSRHLSEIPLSGPDSWEAFSLPQKTLLLNYIHYIAGGHPERTQHLIQTYGQALHSGRYPAKLITQALDHALHSPLGELILRRLTFILATEDVSAKLYELQDPRSLALNEALSTAALVQEMNTRKLSLEAMAHQLNHSVHTAYLNDRRIALQVASFYLSLGDPSLLPSRQSRAKRGMAATFADSILPRWRRGQVFSVEDMLDLLESRPSGTAEQFTDHYREGNFEIQILEGKDFDAMMQDRKHVQNCAYSYFIQRPAPEKSVIFIRRFETPDFQNPAAIREAFQHLLLRVHYLIHEWEHWRHFSRGSHPYTASFDRPNRLGSEMCALLEEFRWLSLHVDNEILQNVHYLGDSFVVYLRSVGEATYFLPNNEGLARQVIP